MRDFFINLLTFSGTAIGLFLMLLGWVLKSFVSDKSKVLGWVLFVLFAILGGTVLVLRNILGEPLA